MTLVIMVVMNCEHYIDWRYIDCYKYVFVSDAFIYSNWKRKFLLNCRMKLIVFYIMHIKIHMLFWANKSRSHNPKCTLNSIFRLLIHTAHTYSMNVRLFSVSKIIYSRFMEFLTRYFPFNIFPHLNILK